MARTPASPPRPPPPAANRNRSGEAAKKGGARDKAGQDKRASHKGGQERAGQAHVIQTINETLRGPVLEIYRSLLPPLRTMDYEGILATPTLVDGCLRLFEKRRDLFAALLVTETGAPVTDDDTPLRCGRSVTDIRTLVVRTAAKKYFRAHGDRIHNADETKARAGGTVSASLVARLFDLVARLWPSRDGRKPASDPARKPTDKGGADRLYEAMAPYLRHPWQVPLIPYYVALPRTLVAEMGEGLLSLRRPDDLESLLRIGRADFNEAQAICGDLSREMLDTNPRAAQGVTRAGGKEYERLRSGLHAHMGPRFWTVFAELDVLDSLRTKSTADIVEMATHLDRIGSNSVDSLVKFLQRPQIAPFLRVADAVLGREVFDTVFGVPGNPKLARAFAQKAAQLRVDRDDPEDFDRKLTFVFQAYRTAPDEFAKAL
ncbi:hypothetical protein [Roseospira visakhapatnamensis]|uniref:Uncharacterized protein n=1 Tax=Roseospira visakhapatnamensis TaxID=390880 RepID=A0A7W6WB39_9PROT|nr:hypothetical protein [Roseospira visakhapatnamensis]MBB4267649.1 hypothetical protein [Roseospira visakhapatnamensis]